MKAMLRRFAASTALLLLSCASDAPQRILDTRSEEAARIAGIWWLMLAIASALCVLVLVLVLVASVRAVRRHRGGAPKQISGNGLVLAGGIILPVLVLFPLLIHNYRVGTAVLRPPAAEADALTIEVIGHQFWWEVRYPRDGIVTANEVRMPVGQRVRIQLTTPDVIHSFWVPQLHGKIDMIPGRVNTLWIRADEPGFYRGQCAEYCGMAHALMAFWLEALELEEFENWIAHRRSRQPAPPAPRVALGRAVFIEAGCHLCHATPDLDVPPVLGQPGPDLSDLATRSHIAAGTLPNNRGSLARWIVDPQGVKPGNRMPPTYLTAGDLDVLLDYLESLR